MIKLEKQQGIAIVTLSRAQKQNALSFAMFVELNKIITKLKKDRSIRAVVLKGDGDHFCAGLDIAAVMASPLNIIKLLFKWLPGNKNLAQRVVLGWQSLSVPVIAQINGNCLGGGLQIALGADYRIVHHDAQFAIMEARWGLCPDMGANVVMSGLVKRDQALWLASHADPISALQAKELGLVTQVTDDTEAATQKMLEILLAAPPTLWRQLSALPSKAIKLSNATYSPKKPLAKLDYYLAQIPKRQLLKQRVKQIFIMPTLNAGKMMHA